VCQNITQYIGARTVRIQLGPNWPNPQTT
jgi:hypothetical protein